jgi:hypothetical protein
VGRNCNLFAALRPRWIHTLAASVRQVETPMYNQAKESTKLTTAPNTRRHILHALKTPLHVRYSKDVPVLDAVKTYRGMDVYKFS